MTSGDDPKVREPFEAWFITTDLPWLGDVISARAAWLASRRAALEEAAAALEAVDPLALNADWDSGDSIAFAVHRNAAKVVLALLAPPSPDAALREERVARIAARRACEEIEGNPVLLTSEAIDAIVARAIAAAKSLK